MNTQVRHKKPLRNPMFLRLSDEHDNRVRLLGGVLYIRSLIDEDIAKEARRIKAKRIKNEKIND